MTNRKALVELNSPPEPLLLEVNSVSKSFPGVQALMNVNVDVKYGECHSWIGENGAGKSTLIKILSGSQFSDTGQFKMNGLPVRISSPHVAHGLGLSFIFQELSVVNGLTVADNIFLGNESRSFLSMKRKKSELRAQKILDRIGFGHVDPSTYVVELSTAEKQAVMVARALSIEAKVIFMDEVTATLNKIEVDKIFKLIEVLKKEGRSTVFVSHRLDEIAKISDRVTIFKDGHVVGTYLAGDLSVDKMVRLMIGRDLKHIFPNKDRSSGKTLFKIRDLCTDSIKHVTFDINPGKIIGVGGLVGSGRTELLNALFGVDLITSGSISLDNEIIKFKNCRDAIERGIGMVPEDRRGQGIIALRSVRDNISITWSLQRRTGNWVAKAREVTQKFVLALNIRTSNIEKQIGLLSGGNQQKAILARWLAVTPKVLLLDEPTRGVDVGAKSEIYEIIDDLARNGMAIVLVSSELPELLGLSDDIIVMSEGNFMGTLPGSSTEEEVMKLAIGVRV